MVDGTNSDAEFRRNSQGSLLDTHTFLELFDASINIFLKKTFHPLTQHDLTFVFLVRQAG